MNSFSKAIWEQTQVPNSAPSMWLGVAPPKVELHVWFVLQQKLNTRSRLKRLNLIQVNEAYCPFCVNEETINHLFLHCNFTWKIWSECMLRWGIQMPITDTLEEWLECWKGVVKGDFQSKLWTSLFFVVVWSMWYQRNKVVFEKEQIDWNYLHYLINLRLGFWLKGWDNSCPFNPG